MKINWLWVAVGGVVATIAYFIWKGNAAPAPSTPLKGLGYRGQKGNRGVTVSPSGGYEAIVAPAYNPVEEEVTEAVERNARPEGDDVDEEDVF
jgi:hypothetical protein